MGSSWMWWRCFSFFVFISLFNVLVPYSARCHPCMNRRFANWVKSTIVFVRLFWIHCYYSHAPCVHGIVNSFAVRSKSLVFELNCYCVYVCLSRWFHPSISSRQATELLLNHGAHGSFLVRPSESNPRKFVMCIR